MKRKLITISSDTVYSDPIIGFDREFWNYCVEEDKLRVSRYKWSFKSKRYEVYMRCPKGHEYYLTPFEFKYKRKCPFCIENGEVGAINVDQSIEIYYDDIYIIEEISENSVAPLKWKCPLCKSIFKKSMVEMINVYPRCDFCNDGQMDHCSQMPDEMLFIK